MDYNTKLEYFNKLIKVCKRIRFKRLQDIEEQDAKQISYMLLWDSIEEIVNVSKSKHLSMYATALRLLDWKAFKFYNNYNNLIKVPSYMLSKFRQNKQKIEQINKLNYFTPLDTIIKQDNNKQNANDIYLTDNYKAVEKLEREIYEDNLYKMVNNACNVLNPKYKYIVNSYYGLNGFEPKDLKAIGVDLGISGKAVWQQLQRIKSKLRKRIKREDCEL